MKFKYYLFNLDDGYSDPYGEGGYNTLKDAVESYSVLRCMTSVAYYKFKDGMYHVGLNSRDFIIRRDKVKEWIKR